MRRAPEVAVFVTRQAASDRLMISVDTFETWVRSGFMPRAHIVRGQIVRWHWPSIEEHLLGTAQAPRLDPSVEALRLLKPSTHGANGDGLTAAAAEMKQRYEAAKAQWKRDIHTEPLSKRERNSLRQFDGVAVGKLVRFGDIKGLGIGTAESLDARGFLEIRHHSNDRSRLVGWVLTPLGENAVKTLITEEQSSSR